MSKTHFGEPLNWHLFAFSKSSRMGELFQDGEDFQEAVQFRREVSHSRS
jgi:hypothetical protein